MDCKMKYSLHTVCWKKISLHEIMEATSGSGFVGAFMRFFIVIFKAISLRQKYKLNHEFLEKLSVSSPKITAKEDAYLLAHGFIYGGNYLDGELIHSLFYNNSIGVRVVNDTRNNSRACIIVESFRLNNNTCRTITKSFAMAFKGDYAIFKTDDIKDALDFHASRIGDVSSTIIIGSSSDYVDMIHKERMDYFQGMILKGVLIPWGQ
jgi:hypothetical protein